MDFFERQERARRHTKYLEIYFVLAIIGIVAMTYAVGVLVFNYYSARGHRYIGGPSEFVIWEPRLFATVTIATLAVIFFGSLYKIQQLASGGSVVAEMLGGRVVIANTTDPDERKLLNVVEEMALASGTPVPQVYVLDEERGINAFAAGHTTSDMVVCATRGTVKALTRDELQGVVGHEFSHILNGDMRLNLRLMGLIFGILCIAIFGRIMMQTRGRNNPLPLLGLMLLAVGSIGVFFSKLIKSAVSREREFLADASAVQFTRNPEGLANALKKVGGSRSRISDPNAEDASHLFFANGLSESFLNMFSTHPPIGDRIRALDPGWDGKFTPVEWREETKTASSTKAGLAGQTRTVLPPKLGDLLGRPVAIGMLGTLTGGVQQPGLAHVGAPTLQHLDYAADLRSNLPPALASAAREPMSAVALIYALLLDHQQAPQASQLAQLQQRVDAPIHQVMVKLLSDAVALESRARLPLATLSLTALRRLSPAQYQQFNDTLKFIISCEQQAGLFEFALQKMVLRQLDPCFMSPKKTMVQYYVLKPVVADCAVLLSALARAGQEKPDDIQSAFQQGAQLLNVEGLALVESDACDLKGVDAALDHLNQVAPPIKKQVLNACAATVAADGVILEAEAELLRAIADAVDCPIPPFLSL